MSDKTFKDRVKEEIDSFSEIYAQFKEDLQAKSDEHSIESNWLHLFDVPFEGSRKQPKVKTKDKPPFEAPNKHEAVLDAINELGVHRLRLGALEIKDSRISAALELGLLAPDDIVPPSSEEQSDYDRLALRYTTDRGDPIFWRTLLEVLCRALMAPRGPRPWSQLKQIELAFDLDEIRRDLLPNARWDEDAAIRILNTEKRYASKYPGSRDMSGIGKDRVTKITSLIGPMDDEALNRLKKRYPESFFKVADAREHRMFLGETGTIQILDMAEGFGDALSGSRDEPED